MQSKIVGFIGHRYIWKNIGIEHELNKTIVTLINQGYNVFYDGNKGFFDELCAKTIFKLKNLFPEIKIYKILTNYKHNNEPASYFNKYDGLILPDLDNIHPKQKIIKRNQWIISSCDVLVCHIQDTHRSGAYKSLVYAKKLNKHIIYI